MFRFIKKVNDYGYYQPVEVDEELIESVQNAANETLYKIEEAEEKLGTHFLVLYHALTEGIYASMYGGEPDDEINRITFIDPKYLVLRLCDGEPYLYYEWGWPGPDYSTYLLKEYRTTWALRKEELILPF